MPEIITHAPIQTRGDTLQRHERFLGLLGAEAINRIREYQTGQPQPRVDIWNTVGHKVERGWEQQGASSDRQAYISSQIQQRYAILQEEYGIKTTERISIRDDDEEYLRITSERIRELIAERRIILREETFSYCQKCDYTIAPVAASIRRCPECNGDDLEPKWKKNLFLQIGPEQKEGIIETTRIFPESARGDLRRWVLTMPEGLQIGKQREYGLALDAFGADEDFVLDPKIALALAPEITEELEIGRISTFIQGIDSIGHLAPFVFLMGKDCEAGQISYVATRTVPSFGRITDQNRSFYSFFLPLAAISGRTEFPPEQLVALFKEHQRTKGRAVSELSRVPLVRDEGNPPHLNLSALDHVFELVSQYRLKDALSELRDFIYEDLSQYCRMCAEQRIVPNQQQLKTTENITGLFLGDLFLKTR